LCKQITTETSLGIRKKREKKKRGRGVRRRRLTGVERQRSEKRHNLDGM